MFQGPISNHRKFGNCSSYCFLALSAGAVEYTECISAEVRPPPMSVLYLTLNHLMISSSNAGALGNEEYLFITIAPRFTLAQNGSNWKGPIHRSNQTLWVESKWVETNDMINWIV